MPCPPPHISALPPTPLPQIQLSNHVGAAPWFSMPHLADDGYHRAFAQQVKDTLRPDLKVYVEWSNEVRPRVGGGCCVDWTPGKPIPLGAAAKAFQ